MSHRRTRGTVPAAIRAPSARICSRKSGVGTAPRTFGGAGVALFFADELDISLLPKVGYQWMPKGAQVEIMTPGTNEKRYLNQTTRHSYTSWTACENPPCPSFFKGGDPGPSESAGAWLLPFPKEGTPLPPFPKGAKNKFCN